MVFTFDFKNSLKFVLFDKLIKDFDEFVSKFWFSKIYAWYFERFHKIMKTLLDDYVNSFEIREQLNDC